MAAHGRAVHVGAVDGVEIVDDVALFLGGHARVLARDAVVVEDEVIVLAAADEEGRVGGQAHPLPVRMRVE